MNVNHSNISKRYYNENGRILNSTERNVDIFENFLNIYKQHKTYSIQTPEMAMNYQRERGINLPRRICGDWNSKVKLLQYRSSGPIIGLHFMSDYSHHFGGYKAKVVIKNCKFPFHFNYEYLDFTKHITTNFSCIKVLGR